MNERLINVQVEFSDDNDDWFETFLARAVRPVLETGLVKQYWFGQYGGKPTRRPRVRFLTDKADELREWKPDVAPTPLETAINKHVLAYGKELEYDKNKTRADYYSGSRFLSPNATNNNKDQRAQLVFSYLHSVCALHIESLVGPDANGRFTQEKNEDQNNPHGSIFETLHHLLCNTTGVATEVQLAVITSNQIFIESPLYWNEGTKPQLQEKGITFNELGRFKVRF